MTQIPNYTMEVETEITISDQRLDDNFMDEWDRFIIETERYNQRAIRTITLNNVQLDPNTWYSIFQDFVNLNVLNIYHTRLTSKTLHLVLTAVNPYALNKLDLSHSRFDTFDGNDLIGLNSLFSLDLVLPEFMDTEIKQILADILGGDVIKNCLMGLRSKRLNLNNYSGSFISGPSR
jgi:hypothetical protein